MRWIRINRRASSVFALFALFFQLAIAVTHTHRHASGYGADHPLVSFAGEISQVAPGEHPAHGPHSGPICDLCVLLHAAAVGDIAVPPTLAVPFAAPIFRLSVIVVDWPDSIARLFLPQSRAPPAAV